MGDEQVSNYGVDPVCPWCHTTTLPLTRYGRILYDTSVGRAWTHIQCINEALRHPGAMRHGVLILNKEPVDA